MIRVGIILLLATAPVLYAAGEPVPDEMEKPAEDASQDRPEALPRSMIPQGIIGRIDRVDGYSLLHTQSLIAMRRQLVARSGGAE